MPKKLHRLSWRHHAGLAAAVLTAWAAPLGAHAQTHVQTEATIKAKLTLSLTRFAQWPANVGGETLRLCLVQRDAAITQAFDVADGQVINGRRIQVVKAPPLAGCHVLYIHSSAERVADLIRATSSSAVLIVSDADGTLALGAMVEFVPVNDSIRFDINMAAVRQAQLTISSQVLKLARQVRE